MSIGTCDEYGKYGGHNTWCSKLNKSSAPPVNERGERRIVKTTDELIALLRSNQAIYSDMQEAANRLEEMQAAVDEFCRYAQPDKMVPYINNLFNLRLNK